MERVEKERKTSMWITILIVVLIAVIAYFAITQQGNDTSEEVAKCIGSKSMLYIQLGCSHCQTQEELFGENIQYLKRVDCFYEPEKCQEKQILYTPTWIINKQRYEEVLSIDKLRELTKC